MKTIVVATDFSKGSVHAISYAVELSNVIKANILLVWVNKKNFDSEFPFEVRSMAEEAHDKLKKLIVRFQPKMKFGKMEYKIREGKVYQEIINQAKYIDANLIVAGTHGVSGFEEFWIGSNAAKIVTHSECPVITVRYGQCIHKIEKIVMPLDIDNETVKKVPFVADFAKLFDAEVHIVACNTTGLEDMKNQTEDFSTKAVNYFKQNKIKYKRAAIQNINISDSIIQYAKDVNADLISIKSSFNSNTFSFILGSTAEEIVNHSNIPVLTISVK
ncbi:MAG: hypothetical protein A2X12_04105 [Bacteroidetes bacterium GWE2_29_8]|nr:MAG: hypothetical protein A2X12_04105 [Bacteroidetes bacterium GWE2_29_8]OFY24965.1 MAG: hypothetical protein A2X02_07950 [Bacteroidetes bacterium GWF2_29_10]